MTKKNERPRSSVPNKPRESAIYRKIESFITMLIKRTANLPNIPMIQECTKKLTNELLECCTAVSYAYSTPYYDVRYNYLSEMEIHIWLTEITVRHEPQQNCIKRGRLDLWSELPPHKSLFNSLPGIGMPIGNITSQLLANFYLSFLDLW